MIIAKILGGLGNQLFQYAAAKALAKKNSSDVKLDVSGFAAYDLRNFELQELNIPFSIATNEEIAIHKATSAIKRVQERLIPYSRRRFYKEPFFHFDENFFKLSSNIYIQGYFQSEKYFLSIQNSLHKDFDFAHLISDQLKLLSHSFQHKESVAIHIRHGDYQRIGAKKVHGVLSPDYYSRAIGYLKERFTDAHFYIFSDAPEKAKYELQLHDSKIISLKHTSNHYEDFYLMSHCRHNIIANSSFSWWAAWLNQNPDKIVIAPKQWFNNGPKDTQDLLPESWIKL